MGVSVPCGGLVASWSLSPEIFGNPWNLRGQQGLGKEARTRVSRVPTLLGPPSLGGSVRAPGSLGVCRRISQCPSAGSRVVSKDSQQAELMSNGSRRAV